LDRSLSKSFEESVAMAVKFPPIKKNHIVWILSLLLSILGGNAAPSMFAEEPQPLLHCPPTGSSTDGGVAPAVGTAPLSE
jgi:hypothetical protein